MQNRYVGDVGDFGKYGLLRALCDSSVAGDAGPDLKLGIVWYLYPDESHTADGRHISYLMPSNRNLAQFRACDPPLYDALQGLIDGNRRSVRAVSELGVFPRETVTFESWTPEGAARGTLEKRRAWNSEATKATAGSDLVFLDPDNGLLAGLPDSGHISGKHAYLDEIADYLQAGSAVVVYHHLNRTARGEQQIADKLRELVDALGLEHEPLSVWFHRGTARAFFVIAEAATIMHTVRVRVDRMLYGPWGWHFSRLT